jgi:asparagine synthase (glutamine-hydrolysing)
MCRIAGIYSNSYSDLYEKVNSMCDSMKNGGPDDFGLYEDDNIPLVLGHRRLSIIDLSNAGHQPMLSEDLNLVLTFNGEIYNYLELRVVLQGIGYMFKTNTDTEVIINSYLEWGYKSFQKLKGMYAFVIFDKKLNKLILVRDHSGIKPLYYYKFNDTFLFSSEIRGISSIQNEININTNEDWPILFLAFGSITEPFTTLENVYQLQKGIYLEFSLDSYTIVEKPIYITENQNQVIFDELVAKQNIKNSLLESMNSHLISDAPIGLFLSGGVDSSILTILASKLKPKSELKTLSIQFEEDEFSEKVYQDMVVQQTNVKHHIFTISESEFISELPNILTALDQPSIDAINSYFICKKAKEIGLKVVISGVGADEYFGGYQSFITYNKLKFYKILPSFFFSIFEFSPVNKFRRISYLYRNDLVGEFLFFRGIYSINEIARLTNKSRKHVKYTLEKIKISSKPKDNFESVQVIEADIYMQNQLLKDLDNMSMWHGIEARVPFLDYNVIEKIKGISSNLKLKHGINKYLLKETFKDILPKEIIYRKKMGFTFPFKILFKNINLKETDNQEILKLRVEFKKNKISWLKFWSNEVFINKYK